MNNLPTCILNLYVLNKIAIKCVKQKFTVLQRQI